MPREVTRWQEKSDSHAASRTPKDRCCVWSLRNPRLTWRLRVEAKAKASAAPPACHPSKARDVTASKQAPANLSLVQASSSASTVSEEQEIHDQVDDRTSDRVDRQPLLPTPATVPGALLLRRHLLRHRGGPFHPHRVLRAACPLRSCVVRHVPPRETRSVGGYARRVLNRRLLVGAEGLEPPTFAL